jgi:hypothetical protein
LDRLLRSPSAARCEKFELPHAPESLLRTLLADSHAR